MKNILKMYATDDTIKDKISEVYAPDMGGAVYSVLTSVSRGKDNYDVATFESDGWPLDGSKYITDILTARRPIMSLSLSDDNCGFSTIPTIDITFSSVSAINGITLLLTEDYCTDLTVLFLDETGIAIKTITITGNDKPEIFIPDVAENVATMRIEFIKTRYPKHFARLENIEFGKILTFEDDILSIDTISECNPQCLSIPNGQINFTVVSKNEEFSITNPKGIYQNLKKDQNIYYYTLNNGVKKIQGVYYLSDWKEVQDGIYSFTAVDAIGYLKTKKFIGTNILSETDISTVAHSILADANFKGKISAYTTSKKLNGFIKPQTCAEALYMLATSLGYYVRVTRSGDIQMQSEYNDIEPPILIDYSDMLSPLKITQMNNIQGYKVGYTTWDVVPGIEMKVQGNFEPIYSVVSTDNKPLDYNFDLTNLPQTGGTAISGFAGGNFNADTYSVETDVSKSSILTVLSASTRLGYINVIAKCEFTGANKDPSHFVIKLTGRYLNNISEKYEVQRFSSESQYIDVSGNTLITTSQKANEVGQLLTKYSQNKLKCIFKTDNFDMLESGIDIYTSDKYGNELHGIISRISTDGTGVAEIEVIGSVI